MELVLSICPPNAAKPTDSWPVKLISASFVTVVVPSATIPLTFFPVKVIFPWFIVVPDPAE